MFNLAFLLYTITLSCNTFRSSLLLSSSAWSQTWDQAETQYHSNTQELHCWHFFLGLYPSELLECVLTELQCMQWSPFIYSKLGDMHISAQPSLLYQDPSLNSWHNNGTTCHIFSETLMMCRSQAYSSNIISRGSHNLKLYISEDAMLFVHRHVLLVWN